MMRLIYYELRKIWWKRSFILSIGVLLTINVFLLWYTNLVKEEVSELSSYRTFQTKLGGMTELEKGEYITELKKRIDGVYFVQEVLAMRALSNSIGMELAEQAVRANPGIFEDYYEVYESGDYLILTHSLTQEKTLVDELYEEWERVAGYDEYLRSVQENQKMLGRIAVFGSQDGTSFSARNVNKSAEDYLPLTVQNIRWMPAKALTGSMGGVRTDILLILSVFLFVGHLIIDEKEKKLLYITRSTRNGILNNIVGKLAALWIHCLGMTFLLYGTNLIFYGVTIGYGDMTAGIQSIAPYMESSLSINIWEYILLSIITKGMVLYGIGTILTAVCIAADHIIIPYITGLICCGMGYMLTYALPSVWRDSEVEKLFRYLNPVGLLRTDHIYGAYLNYNIGGYPVSNIYLSWLVIILLFGGGITAGILLFIHGDHLELKRMRFRIHMHSRPYVGLWYHECYKIMVTDHACIILLVFSLLILYHIAGPSYQLSAQEMYYQDIMMQLEGELTNEKEALILSEQGRYEEAFQELERIDTMVMNGTLSTDMGDSLKAEWYTVTAFYPSFERVMQQYLRIREKGGDFIYDTGYLYLFGRIHDDYWIDLLLLTTGIIFAYSNVMAMEYKSGSWNLIGATVMGKRKIIVWKLLISIITAGFFSLVPIVCKYVYVASAFPMHGFSYALQSIPFLQACPLPVSVGGYVVLGVIMQIMLAMMVAILVLCISRWRKTYIQTVFFCMLILVLPLVLKLLGLLSF